MVLELIDNATQLIRESFPESQVVVALGNHDYYPVDQLPATGTKNEIYEAIYEMWKPWMDGTESEDTFTTGDFWDTFLVMNMD